MALLSNYRKVFETNPKFFYNWTLNWYNEHAYGFTKKSYLKYIKTWDSFVEKVKIQRPVIESNEFLDKTIIIYFDAISIQEHKNGATDQEDPFPAFSFRVIPLNGKEVEIEIQQNYNAPEIAIIKDSIWADVLALFRYRETVQYSEQMIQTPTTILPEIKDPTDKRIWEIVRKDPSITDTALGQKLGNIGRQNVNRRRKTIEKMGYQVRKVSRQKM